MMIFEIFDVCSLFPSLPDPQLRNFSIIHCENTITDIKINDYVSFTNLCIKQFVFRLKALLTNNNGTVLSNTFSLFAKNLFMSIYPK